MIDFDRKLIFIHIPKTAGTSIEAALLQDSRIENHNDPVRTELLTSVYQEHFLHREHPHSSVQRHREALGEAFEDYTIFTVVRNPYERVFSRFCYTYRYKERSFFTPERLEDFVELFNFAFRYDTLISLEDEECLDAILDFQQLEEELARFLNRHGMSPVALPHANKSPVEGMAYKAFYTEQSRAKVEEIFAAEFQRFNWSFDGSHNGLPLWDAMPATTQRAYSQVVSSRLMPRVRSALRRRLASFGVCSYSLGVIRAAERYIRSRPHAGKDLVSVSICSHPARVALLKFSVFSLLRQVDAIYIYLNNIESIPWWLRHPKIHVQRSSSALGDLKSTGKYYFDSMIEGFHFVADDDLIYPSDYVSRMLQTLEKYGRNCLLCSHGSVVKYPPIRYYQHRILSHFAEAQSRDMSVQIGSFGTLAYHTDVIRFTVDDFPSPNMDDVYGSLKARRQGLPIISIARPHRWIHKTPPVNEDLTIYSNREQYEDRIIEVLLDNSELFFSAEGSTL